MSAEPSMCDSAMHTRHSGWSVCLLPGADWLSAAAMGPDALLSSAKRLRPCTPRMFANGYHNPTPPPRCADIVRRTQQLGMGIARWHVRCRSSVCMSGGRQKKAKTHSNLRFLLHALISNGKLADIKMRCSRQYGRRICGNMAPSVEAAT